MDTLEQIEREARAADPSEVVGYLSKHLGPELCAYLTGATDRKAPAEWEQGHPRLEAVVEERLQCAYRATRLLEDFGDGTVRTWFLGANELLGDDAAARVLRHGESPDDWQMVVPAAQDFAQSGAPPEGTASA